MGQNVEVKDVHQTEYLDKNGLDMLWAKVKENTHNQVEVERNRAVAKENSITNSLSEFVSKTATDTQVINSPLGIVGGIIQIVDYTADEDPVSLELASTGLEFNGSDISTIELNASDVNSNNGSRIRIEAHNENPHIALQSNVGSDYTFQNNLTITNEGISNTDNNANHVFATDGSIADLTRYALSSTLAALEQKVTANTTAISAKQDAGKYIPYEKTSNMNTYVLPDDWNIELRVDVGEEKYNSSKISAQDIYVKNASGQYTSIGSENIRVDSGGNASNDSYLLLTPSRIHIFGKRGSERFSLGQNGIRLEDGDNNHVLTSNASTINITQYAKKTELPVVPTKISQLTNDSNFITAADVDLTPYALKSELPIVPTKVSQLQNDSNFAYKAVVDELFDQLARQIENVSSSKQNKIIPGNIDISAANFQNTIVSLKETILSLITTLEKSGLITVTRS